MAGGGGVMFRIVAWLDGMLTDFAARQELRVRHAIARAASRARSHQSKLRAE